MLCRVGLVPAENEVRFDKLTVEVEATLAKDALPSIPGWYWDTVQVGW